MYSCNGCSFYFLVSLIKNLLVKTVFASYYLKLCLLMSLKCLLILPNVSFMFLIHMFKNKNKNKNRYLKGRPHSLGSSLQGGHLFFL